MLFLELENERDGRGGERDGRGVEDNEGAEGRQGRE